MIQIQKSFIALLVSVALTGCASSGAKRPEASAVDNTWMIGAIVWQRTSAEMRALSHQAYNLAKLVLDKDLKTRLKGKKSKRAIIVDADETVIDNTTHQAWMAAHNKAHPEGWTEWTERAEATAIPGALEFLKYAKSNGVSVFYVTNRTAGREVEGTIRNLEKLGFPDPKNVIGKTDTSSKEARRQKIDQDHHIVLLAGDNLNDFSDAFLKKSLKDRATAVETLKGEFGSRFIVLPNPMYGDWEGAVYEYNWKLSEQDKAKKRLEAMSWK